MAEALPGGYKVGEKVFYTGASQTWDQGYTTYKTVHGQQGEVTGPGTGNKLHTHVNVLFPGNRIGVDCPLTEVSRGAPPPLPGGYTVGEKVFFTGASETVQPGYDVVHGQQGEVTGAATAEATKGKGVGVLFPGNKGSVECLLTMVSRDAPPPLPGGYKGGEKVFFTGANFTYDDDDKLVHGQEGEVTGPVTLDGTGIRVQTKGEGVLVRFPGNKSNAACLLTEVSRSDPKAAEAAAAKAAAEKAAALGLLQPLEALSLDADSLRAATVAAVTYCDAQGATSFADLVEYDLLDGLMAALALKLVQAKKLSASLKGPAAAMQAATTATATATATAPKASPPTSDMAKLSVDSTPSAKVQIEPIAVSLLAANAPGITTEQSNVVQRVLQSLMDRPWPEWYPQVCISYATGTRKDTDARGAGPGMLQAATISHALYNAGIACASGLCVSAGNDWKDFLPKIDSRFARCEVLIVLLSPAFYLSHPCLLEAHKATKAKRMEIIPLRVAEPLPDKNDQWPNIGKADGTLLDQVQDKLGALNALPPRGLFFDSPTYLDDLVGQVRCALKRGPGEAGAHAGARHVA